MSPRMAQIITAVRGDLYFCVGIQTILPLPPPTFLPEHFIPWTIPPNIFPGQYPRHSLSHFASQPAEHRSSWADSLINLVNLVY